MIFSGDQVGSWIFGKVGGGGGVGSFVATIWRR